MKRSADDPWYVSRQDYLDGERSAPTKSEWVDGVVYAMAGASKRHVTVVSRLMELLAGVGRKKGCLVGSNDLLVETATANYYPDIVGTCRPSDDPYVEHDPCFIVEVLSPSTTRVDRVEKRTRSSRSPRWRPTGSSIRSRRSSRHGSARRTGGPASTTVRPSP